MNPVWLLAAYSIALVGASWAGGGLPGRVRLNHTRIQAAMSFVAGLILGVALYHLLPHALTSLRGPQAVETSVWWMMLGMISMLLLLRQFHFHQHEMLDAGLEGHQPGPRGGAARASWVGIALGLGLHALSEGIALGASVRAGWMFGGGGDPAGAGVFLAILLHKPLDALSITGTMTMAGVGRRARSAANFGFGLLCPAGACLAFGVGVTLGPNEAQVIGRALAWAAGAFVCISLSDLLPEVHFHSHDRAKLTTAFLLGIGSAYALRWLEPGAPHGR